MRTHFYSPKHPTISQMKQWGSDYLNQSKIFRLCKLLNIRLLSFSHSLWLDHSWGYIYPNLWGGLVMGLPSNRYAKLWLFSWWTNYHLEQSIYLSFSKCRLKTCLLVNYSTNMENQLFNQLSKKKKLLREQTMAESYMLCLCVLNMFCLPVAHNANFFNQGVSSWILIRACWRC